eukprot:4222692-Prymnesium_polylepis.1
MSQKEHVVCVAHRSSLGIPIPSQQSCLFVGVVYARAWQQHRGMCGRDTAVRPSSLELDRTERTATHRRRPGRR